MNSETQKANLEQRLEEKYEIREELKCKLNKIRKEAEAQVNAKNSLHQSIVDLEKVICDF